MYNINKEIRRISEEVGYFFLGLYYDTKFYYWLMTKKPTGFCVWSITYQETVNNELPSPSKFKASLENLDPQGYVFQLEKAPSGRRHFQCNLRLKEKMTQTKLRIALKSTLRDFYGAGCLTIRTTHDTKKADFYCMKEETRIEGPWLFPRDIYIGQDLIKKFLPWQEKIFLKVMAEPDEREVTVICDEVGNKGKSLFSKTLGYRHDACVIPLGLTAAQMKSALIGDGHHKIYILDLPRNNKSFQDIFDTIEELKRGHMVSPFHGKMKKLYMSRPHIVCFCNQWPDLRLLSFDMWRLYRISPDMELETVEKHEIQAIQNQRRKKYNNIPVLTTLVNE